MKDLYVEVNSRKKADRITKAIWKRITWKKEYFDSFNEKESFLIFYKPLRRQS